MLQSAATGLAETCRRLLSLCEVLQVELAAPEMAPGQHWVPIDRMDPEAERLIAAESARIESRYGVVPRPHVAASRLLHHYLWSVCLLLSGPWYLTGRIPRLSAAELWIEPDTGALAYRPGECSAGGADELRAAAAGHLGPVLAAFQPHVRRGPHALWGMAADDLASGIWYLGRMLGEEDRAVRIASAVLPGGTPPFPGAADFRRLASGHWTRTRLGCCLYYAVQPPDACLTCPRTTDAERICRLGD